jgi:hypothetical protein
MDRGNKEFWLARGKRIERFAQGQERVRKFVRLSELIDYHATGERGVKIDEAMRHEAYRSFIESILSGHFERRAGEKTKAQILFLSEQSPPDTVGRRTGCCIAAHIRGRNPFYSLSPKLLVAVRNRVEMVRRQKNDAAPRMEKNGCPHI